ncbi:hypothetical protein [Desulfoglaeba alkanexedens]|uniref:Uncharacterized protein n=1 Tax=Desulfoglaeba alkanexedens ALDC TaxID=980445 RepID=A0A4P8L1E8_9BACT|nr:hypothetical protein [Desulfoglaeba alkanexedens]QCQ21403.1 hypothetical protein FDQ92_03935 [Desulfoglaeba alkanexedens ALDC]
MSTDGGMESPTPETSSQRQRRKHGYVCTICGRRWRRSWLLQWQRGFRGSEYGTLAVSLRFLCRELSSADLSDKTVDAWRKPAAQIQRDVADFCREAKRLLLEEKVAGQNANLSKLQSINPTVDALRARLFGSGISHGGFSRRIFDTLDTNLSQGRCLTYIGTEGNGLMGIEAGASATGVFPSWSLGTRVDGGAWEQGQKIPLSLDGRGLG